MRGFRARKWKLPEWIQGFVQELGFVDYGRRRFHYAVLRKDFHPNLKNFVRFLQGSSFLYISEEVPPVYQEFVLRHELREFLKYRGKKDRCRMSLETELKEASAKLGSRYSAYVEWRLHDFNHRSWYCIQDPDNVGYEEKDRYEIYGCLMLLERELKRK